MKIKNYQPLIKFLATISLLLLFPLCTAPPKKKASYRVISLVPSITEIIFALGKESLLVGNTVYCDYPEGAKRIYKVGDFMNPSLEKIVALKPDLVFLTLPTQRIIYDKIQHLKIKTFVSQPRNFDGLLREIKEIGKILGAEKRADSLIAEMTEGMKEIRFPAMRIYVEISVQPLISIGKNSFLSDLLERRSLQNIFSDLDEEYPVVKIEDIIKRNPEIILILHPQVKREDVKKRMGFEEIKATKESRIIDDINPDLLLRPGMRILTGLRQLRDEIKR